MRTRSSSPPGMELELTGISSGVPGLTLDIGSQHNGALSTRMDFMHIDRCIQRASPRIRPCVLNFLLSLRAVLTLATMGSTEAHNGHSGDDDLPSQCTVGFEVPPPGCPWCSPMHDLDVHFGRLCHSQDVIACIEASVIPDLSTGSQSEDLTFVISADDVSGSHLASIRNRSGLARQVHTR